MLGVLIKETIDLSYRRRLIKGGCDGNGPTFKVSSYPRGTQGPQGEPGTTFTSVYGSLATDIGASHHAVVGIYVDFDLIGAYSGVTPDTTNNSITVNSQGIYNSSFSTEINGAPNIPLQLSNQTTIISSNQITT
jgi:hypothetical protein